MTTTITEILETKSALRQQHIIVSEDWIEACISFLRTEQLPSSQNLKKRVQQQWLIADLDEIACPSLPQELPTAQKMTLNGNFALQVQGIMDISRPAYSQLKELEKSTNPNLEFTSAPKAAVPEWEAKPTRMLMLSLTDGCTQVQGMEYRTINFLSPNLLPGIKVLIKGPIECRFGVLMMTSENISILGGAVESKMKQFSRENLLRERLHMEREDAPVQSTDNSINNNTELSNNLRTSTRNAEINFIQQNQISSSVSTRNAEINSIQQNQISSSVSSQNSNLSTNLRNFRSNEDILDNFESDDDFEQNIDLGVLDEIENSQRQSGASQNIDECDPDVWQEDEDVVRDLMEFQDANPEFTMPFEVNSASTSATNRSQDSSKSIKEVFTYLANVINKPASNCVVTVKGFIITVLSKLECTINKGWSLAVKINDGTATLNVDIHDKVLEDIMCISAPAMIKKQAEAVKNMQIRQEVMQTISKCKLTLQNFNGLMDIKFVPDEKPCLVKCTPVSKAHIQQLLERVSAQF